MAEVTGATAEGEQEVIVCQRVLFERAQRRARKLDLGNTRSGSVDKRRVDLFAFGQALEMLHQLEDCRKRYKALRLEDANHVLDHLLMGIRALGSRTRKQVDHAILQSHLGWRVGCLEQETNAGLTSVGALV